MTLAVLVAGLVVFLAVATRGFFVPSGANSPTLKPGDHVLALKGSSVARNELIVFHSPVNGRLVIMRVVAVGGDRLSQQGNDLYVNGRVAARPFLPTPGAVPTMVVPAGTVYVLGDNRGDAEDSRFYGPVPDSNVVGHLIFRYWPLGRIGTL